MATMKDYTVIIQTPDLFFTSNCKFMRFVLPKFKMTSLPINHLLTCLNKSFVISQNCLPQDHTHGSHVTDIITQDSKTVIPFRSIYPI
jgi:hypothetical protein